MAIFYSRYTGALMLRCDCCRETVELYKGETDRLLAHDWMKEHLWKTRKVNDKFMIFCPYCNEAINRKLADKIVETIINGE